MLLVYERCVYLRSERKSEWIQCVTFDSLIVALYQMSADENQQTRFICITETAIEILSLPRHQNEMKRELKSSLPGKAIRTKLSNELWGNSKILILTHRKEEKQFSLWSLTDDEQELTLLFEDSTETKLDFQSFFDFVKVEGQVLDSEVQQVSHLALLCSTGTDKQKQSLQQRSFKLYEMPEIDEKLAEEVKKPVEQKQAVIQDEKLSISGIQNLDFRNVQILAFLSVQTELGTNIVLIVSGPRLSSSVLVFDNDMRRKLLPDLNGLKIVKVADIVYEGHMFAFNEENNLIAANLKYLC